MTRAVLRNQLKRSGAVSLAKAVAGKKRRGGTPWSEGDLESGLKHTLQSYDVIEPELSGELEGKVGLEIGPGESTAVAGCFVLRGAKMYAVERFASVNETYSERLMKHLSLILGDRHCDGDRQVTLFEACFEDTTFPCQMDFIYSVDVMEHVKSPRDIFEKSYGLLRAGGIMVHSIDLAGHQIGDLEHLCCPDWLWHLAFSHIETTNRVRLSEFLSAARDAGFSRVTVRVLRAADVSSIRPRVLDRWRHLKDEDLSALQILITAVK